MRLVFALEPLAEVWPAVIALGEMHWNETEKYRHGQPFKPDRERYIYYEREGMFFMFTARDAVNGMLVGNFGVYITESMHTQERIAVEDAMFLHPDYRRGTNAIRFIRHVRDECFKRGVVEIIFTAKNPRVGRLLRFLTFVPAGEQYSLARGADSAYLDPAVNRSADVPVPQSGPAT